MLLMLLRANIVNLMRIRSSTTSRHTQMHILFSENDGVPTDNSYDVVAGDEESRYMTDVVTPGYRRLSSQGEIIVNSMSSSKSKVTSGGGKNTHAELQSLINGVWTRYYWFDSVCSSEFSARFRQPYSSITARIAGGDPGVLGSFDYSSVRAIESQLVARVLANAADSDAASLVFAAELNKSIDYFSDLVHEVVKINNFLADLRSRDLSAFKWLKMNYRWKYSKSQIPKALVSVANAWLGYRYGLMSSYYDCVSLFRAGRDVGKSRRARYMTRTHTKWDSGLSQTTTQKPWTVLDITSRLTRDTDSSAGCLVQFDPQATSTSTFGGDQVLSAAWELVPYSFVVDWFVDIGKRIKALDGMITRPTLGSWIVHRSSLTEFHSWDDAPRTQIVDGVRYWMRPGSKDSSWILDSTTYVERIANPKLSAIPSINVRLNTSRIADSISLMAQQSSRIAALLRK